MKSTKFFTPEKNITDYKESIFVINNAMHGCVTFTNGGSPISGKTPFMKLCADIEFDIPKQTGGVYAFTGLATTDNTSLVSGGVKPLEVIYLEDGSVGIAMKDTSEANAIYTISFTLPLK